MASVGGPQQLGGPGQWPVWPVVALLVVAGPRAWNGLPEFITNCPSPLRLSPSRNI